jgi:WD40 repeat protein
MMTDQYAGKLCLSPDGKKVARINQHSCFEIWDFDRRSLGEVSIDSIDEPVAMVFAADSNRLFAISDEGQFATVCAATGKVEHCQMLPITEPLAMDASLDGKWLAISCHGEQHPTLIAIGEAADLTSAARRILDTEQAELVSPVTLAFSPDSTRIAAFGFYGGLAVFDVNRPDNPAVVVAAAPKDAYMSSAGPCWSQDGSLLAAVIYNKIQVWDVSAQPVLLREIASLTGDRIEAVAMSAAGDVIATTRTDSFALDIYSIQPRAEGETGAKEATETAPRA